jgi:putative iron-regulated protein
LISEVSASARACAQIPTPFDHAILGDDAAPGRVAIARAIAALRAQANTLDQVQAALKLPEPSVQSASPSVRQ